MLSTMPRPEDTVRGLRPYTGPPDEEDGETRPHDSLVPPPLSYGEGFPNMELEGSRPGTAMGDNSNKRSSGPKPLTPEETIELARRAVESGIQDTKRSLAGSEAVTDVVKPKLTIDLGHSHIMRIPEPVVDVIKDEVERYVATLLVSALPLALSIYPLWRKVSLKLILTPWSLFKCPFYSDLT